MGISSADDAATLVSVLPAISAANTGAATSGWIDVRSYIGTLVFDVVTGAITGTLAGKLRRADDVGGTNAADIAGATHTDVTTANQVRQIIVGAGVGPFMQYVGTVTTGPVLVGISLRGRKATA